MVKAPRSEREAAAEKRQGTFGTGEGRRSPEDCGAFKGKALKVTAWVWEVSLSGRDQPVNVCVLRHSTVVVDSGKVHASCVQVQMMSACYCGVSVADRTIGSQLVSLQLRLACMRLFTISSRTFFYRCCSSLHLLDVWCLFPKCVKWIHFIDRLCVHDVFFFLTLPLTSQNFASG